MAWFDNWNVDNLNQQELCKNLSDWTNKLSDKWVKQCWENLKNSNLWWKSWAENIRIANENKLSTATQSLQKLSGSWYVGNSNNLIRDITNVSTIDKTPLDLNFNDKQNLIKNVLSSNPDFQRMRHIDKQDLANQLWNTLNGTKTLWQLSQWLKNIPQLLQKYKV